MHNPPRDHLRLVPDEPNEPSPGGDPWETDAAVAPHVDDAELNRVAVEQHLLGTVMESAEDLAAVRDTTTAEHFAACHHSAMWTAICHLADNGQPTSPVAVTEALIRSGNHRGLPTNVYAFDVMRHAHPGQGTYWAGILADRHQRRSIADQTRRLGDLAANLGTSYDQIADIADNIAVLAANRGVEGDGPIAVSALATDYLATYMTHEDNHGIPSPWVDLNGLMPSGGFERKQVVTFGGAPGMGKSIAVTDFARHIGVNLQMPTIMFTLEMSEHAAFYRVLAAMTGITEHSIRRRELTAGDLARVDQADQKLKQAPFWIVSGPRSLTQITNEVRKIRNRHGDIACVVVDYVQIVQTEGRKENRQLEVSATMQRLKQFAMGEDVLVVTAAQINRSSAQRLDKRPALSDLRESGEIENSSDVVVLVFREDYYDKESPRSGEADFIVAKNRGGCTDTVTVASQLHLTRFSDMAIA